MRSLSELRLVFLLGLLGAACGTTAPATGSASALSEHSLASAPRAIPSDIAFESLEGPFWVASGGYLIFSDVVERNQAQLNGHITPMEEAFAVSRMREIRTSGSMWRGPETE